MVEQRFESKWLQSPCCWRLDGGEQSLCRHKENTWVLLVLLTHVSFCQCPPSALQIRPLRKPLRLLHRIAEEGEKPWLMMWLKVGACGVGDGQRGGSRVGQGRMARQEAEA